MNKTQGGSGFTRGPRRSNPLRASRGLAWSGLRKRLVPSRETLVRSENRLKTFSLRSPSRCRERPLARLVYPLVPRRYLEVVYVEGQPLRELTTTPRYAERGPCPREPLESLRAETDRSPS